MPELPEVHTTVEGLKKTILGQTIKDVWSDFHIETSAGARKTIKNKKYFDKFKKIVTEAKIIKLERIGKNILIHLSNRHTIVVHMKMTGHLMVGKYKMTPPPSPSGRGQRGRGVWIPLEKGPLQDSYNKFIHLVFSLPNGRYLVLSDMRKFASVTVFKTEELHKYESLAKLGPDPLDPSFSAKKFFEIMHAKKRTPIKSALLDQSAISGIGNIYSDEILWETSIHPLSLADKIPQKKTEEMFKAMQKILRFSIKHGGDSKSDYRNIFGKKGEFQNFHKVYGEKGQKCQKKNCLGIIQRIIVRGRSAHFCPKHQIKYGRQ
jgi:formamidopyrimidine-DNA glycosylase